MDASHSLGTPCRHSKKARDGMNPLNRLVEYNGIGKLNCNSYPILDVDTFWTPKVEGGPVIHRDPSDLRIGLDDAVPPRVVADQWRDTSFNWSHLPPFMQYGIDNGLSIYNMSECIEVIKQRGQISGREVH